jgi:hypothetical protein
MPAMSASVAVPADAAESVRRGPYKSERDAEERV